MNRDELFNRSEKTTRPFFEALPMAPEPVPRLPICAKDTATPPSVREAEEECPGTGIFE